MKVVILSGTPGTGKTTVSKAILNYLNAKIINLNELAITQNLITGYDLSRETSIINPEKLINNVEDQIKDLKTQKIEFLIIEGHFSDIIPEDNIDFAIVLRCDPDVLYKRLEERGYKKEKIIENIQSEILGNSVNFLINKSAKFLLFEIDTSKLNVIEVANVIIKLIQHDKNNTNYKVGKIDWLEKISNQNRINDFFDLSI